MRKYKYFMIMLLSMFLVVSCEDKPGTPGGDDPTAVEKSSEASIIKPEVSSDVLWFPEFSPDVTDYSLRIVDTSIDNLSFKVKAKNSKASLPGSLDFSSIEYEVPVVKTLTCIAEDGTKKTYSFKVVRGYPKGSAELLSLSATNSPEIIISDEKDKYTLIFPVGVDSTTVSFEPLNPNSTVKDAGGQLLDSKSIDFNSIASDSFTVDNFYILSEDGLNEKYYTVEVVQDVELKLDNLVLAPQATLTTEFDPEIKEYQINVLPSYKDFTVSWEAAADVRVDGPSSFECKREDDSLIITVGHKVLNRDVEYIFNCSYMINPEFINAKTFTIYGDDIAAGTYDEKYKISSSSPYGGDYYYSISKYEITEGDVAFLFPDSPMSLGSSKPATNMTYKQAVAFCNRLSLVMGRSCFYSVKDKNYSDLMWKTFTWDFLSSGHWSIKCNTRSKGYRLPTKIEWTAAAIAFVDEHDKITCLDARYKWYDFSGYDGTNSSSIGDFAVYNSGATSSVGSKLPNSLGLYDMSGNVSEFISNEIPSRSDTTLYFFSIGGDYSQEDMKIFWQTGSGVYWSFKDDKTGFRIAFK
ncbi:MAG: SUMF1/EgtB/PvdO family nonheme iron enzyme [Spirochaetales bacterium]|nr:SUMF1/EgtB/PvdO family nonheme iron enzyme [Spirochaetales bacterium]